MYYPEKQEQEEGRSDLMDKVGLAIGGLVAAGGAAAVAHALSVSVAFYPTKSCQQWQ